KNANKKVFHISSPGLPPYEDLNPLKTGNMNAPRLVQPIDGDFTIETEINFIPKLEGYQGVALLIWQDDQHFLRLEVSTWQGEGYGVNFSYYYDRNRKGDDNGGRIAIDKVATKLRVERRGNLYTAFWQQYNGEWIPITRTFRMSSDRVLAGLL